MMGWLLTFLIHSTLWCCLAWLWTRLRRDRQLPVPCMARRRSHLRVRVDRLMNDGGAREAPARIWRRLGAIGTLALALLLAPSVAPAVEPGGPHEHDAEDEIRMDLEREHHDTGETLITD